MRITNEQIIQSARRQRQAVNNSMDVEPWSSRPRQKRGLAAIIAIAASFVSFIAGYGLHSVKTSQADAQHLAQVIKVEHDTIMQTETLRDTVYQTRIVTKYVKPKYDESLTAQVSPQPSTSEMHSTSSSDENMACSMLCDDIPYDLLARP